jgi:hypothetical protein
MKDFIFVSPVNGAANSLAVRVSTITGVGVNTSDAKITNIYTASDELHAVTENMLTVIALIIKADVPADSCPACGGATKQQA